MGCEKCRIVLGKDEVREIHLDTTHGYVKYGRYRYRCCKCEEHYYPADNELELSKNSRMSPKKEGQVVQMSVNMTYDQVAKTYEKLTGLPASKSVAQRVVQVYGEKVIACESKVIYKAVKGDGREHVGSDGTMVNIRKEGWKEVKIGSYYKVDAERKKTEVRYVATTESREEIGQQLYALAGRPTLERTAQMGFISDGAEWLEDMRKLHFIKATGILDFYHASEYVGNLGKAFYGETKKEEWIEEKLENLKAGLVKEVQKGFKRMKAKTEEQKEELEKTCRYFKNNEHKMKYDEYVQAGFHIGSGIIEAGCKHVIGNRFKRAGMRWSRLGARNLLALRVAYLNDDWENVSQAQCN